MPLIKPFDAWLVAKECVNDIVSPAYDSVSPKQRREFASRNPENFLNTMRLMEDFPDDARPDHEELLLMNKAHLDKLLSNGSFNRLLQQCMFLYQLDTGSHIQTGVVCEVSISEYEQGKIRKHENTLTDKEDLLAHYHKVVGAASSPICLTYSQNNKIDQIVKALCSKSPDLEFESYDNVEQRIWCITDKTQMQELIALFNTVDTTYLTDGHHRAASGLRYAKTMRGHNLGYEQAPYNQLLVALFPDNQLNLLPFHRCVKDLNNKSVEQILCELERYFVVKKLDCTSFESLQKGRFGMYVNDIWYQLDAKPECFVHDNPVSALDVSILQNLILEPILGIHDMRNDPRLDYVAGISSIEGIRNKLSDGWKIVFVCHATSISQLMAVADANAMMPPKSTYFDPKPRSGIVVRLK